MAQSQLSTLLHLPLEERLSVQDIQQYEPYEKKLSECKQEALQNRPEMREVNNPTGDSPKKYPIGPE